jgi:DNA invertase Pin-like site-specific DNA recombinase
MMTRLTTDKVELVKASYGVYAAADVARAFQVHRSTVTRIWNGEYHQDVPPAEDAPNIVTRNRPGSMREDVLILLDRGMTVQEVADELNISRSSVYALRGGTF